MIEITELDFDDNASGSKGGFGKSTNFGGGLELLMNDRIKDSKKPTSDIDLDDLNNLENEKDDIGKILNNKENMKELCQKCIMLCNSLSHPDCCHIYHFINVTFIANIKKYARNVLCW